MKFRLCIRTDVFIALEDPMRRIVAAYIKEELARSYYDIQLKSLSFELSGPRLV